MLGTFLYSTFSQKNIKALPQNIQDEFSQSNMSDVDMNVDIGNAADEEIGGVESFAEADISEEESDDENIFYQFFNDDEVPSIEKAEQFLIEQALKKFDGNRRKASEALGVSERTLYRKLDQYDLQ
jgi:DNA-binding NtrC family response regulator